MASNDDVFEFLIPNIRLLFWSDTWFKLNFAVLNRSFATFRADFLIDDPIFKKHIFEKFSDTVPE